MTEEKLILKITHTYNLRIRYLYLSEKDGLKYEHRGKSHPIQVNVLTVTCIADLLLFP